MRKDMTQRVLQLIYDLFCGSGGMWPTLAHLQRALDRQGNSNVDAARVVERIPARLLKPSGSAAGYPASAGQLTLTVEGIRRCTRSDEDIANFMAAVRWLARRAEHADLAGDASEPGMRFTTLQLAEAVPLSIESDGQSIRRLVAILQVEGLVKENGYARRQPWARSIRRLGNPGILWRRAIFGL